MKRQGSFYVPDSELFDSFLKDIYGLTSTEVGEDRIVMPRMAGGAEIFPDEGLDHILGKVPLAAAAIQATYYLGLFTAATATTTPGRTELLANAGVGEPSGGGYARVPVANSEWGAIVTSGSGRRSTAAQKSFAASTAAWGTINGFFLATAASGGAAIFYANFEDGNAAPVTGPNYTVRVTPFFHIDQ